MRVPSKARTASSASRGSSNSTKAKPGGFLATHTFTRGPYLEKADSNSCLASVLPRLPTYTLQSVLILLLSAIQNSEELMHFFRPPRSERESWLIKSPGRASAARGLAPAGELGRPDQRVRGRQREQFLSHAATERRWRRLAAASDWLRGASLHSCLLLLLLLLLAATASAAAATHRAAQRPQPF